jgi:hypothetical protein
MLGHYTTAPDLPAMFLQHRLGDYDHIRQALGCQPPYGPIFIANAFL